MSAPAALANICGQLDPVNNTCTTSNTVPKRALSLPLKRHRAFSSPRRSGSGILISSQARVTAAATVLTDTVRSTGQQTPTSVSDGRDRLRQLEASFKAQSAAELEHIQAQPRTSGLDGTFSQLERSWQSQAEASTSGRGSVSDCPAQFLARLCSKGSNSRSKRRSSRVYASSLRRHSAQTQGVAAPDQSNGCPDTHFCAVLRTRLKAEKHQHRISR